MAVKRYDGSAWQVVAGKGDQGTSSSISTWVKTATGGETSVSGNDDNSQPLSYTVGQELVFINGALQKRGADYTATTGNSITGLTALAANDVVTVWTVNAFSVTGAIANSIVDAKGDLIVATGADTPGILTAGTTGQVLTVDSTTGTGLKWATPSSGAVVQVKSTTYSTSTSNATTTYADTGLSLSITPTSASNKILVIVQQYQKNDNTAPAYETAAYLRLMRDSTAIYNDGKFAWYGVVNGAANYRQQNTTLVYLDSPATTSSITYKTQQKAYVTTVTAQDASTPSSITLMEVTP